MATFAAHSVLGAGIVAGPARMLGAPRRVVNACTVYGALFGGLPDTLDWLVAALGLLPRWKLYVILHHDPPWWLLAQLPFTLHLWLDTYFHDSMRPGWNWWSELWLLEVWMWVMGGMLLWIAYRRRTD